MKDMLKRLLLLSVMLFTQADLSAAAKKHMKAHKAKTASEDRTLQSLDELDKAVTAATSVKGITDAFEAYAKKPSMARLQITGDKDYADKWKKVEANIAARAKDKSLVTNQSDWDTVYAEYEKLVKVLMPDSTRKLAEKDIDGKKASKYLSDAGLYAQYDDISTAIAGTTPPPGMDKSAFDKEQDAAGKRVEGTITAASNAITAAKDAIKTADQAAAGKAKAILGDDKTKDTAYNELKLAQDEAKTLLGMVWDAKDAKIADKLKKSETKASKHAQDALKHANNAAIAAATKTAGPPPPPATGLPTTVDDKLVVALDSATVAQKTPAWVAAVLADAKTQVNGFKGKDKGDASALKKLLDDIIKKLDKTTDKTLMQGLKEAKGYLSGNGAVLEWA